MNGKGLRLGGVAVLAAVQLIAAAPTSAAHRTPTDVGRTYPVRSNSTARPHPVRHHGFFRRHSQISVGTTITTGWNLITVPVLGSISSASALAASMNDASQLGAGAVTTIATYSSGQYHLYIPSYSPDLPLQPEQGIWVYSSKSGTWHASGAAFQTSAPINLQTGWNLVGLPYPTSGLTTTQIAGQVGGSAVQRMALYQSGNYTTWQAGQSGFSVPAGTGVWLYSTTATTWSPQAIVTPPPNPASVAPPVSTGVATTVGASTQFLYTGSKPIQTGVAPGTINTLRVTVLRGKVLNRDGSALAGATVTILNHPEFGQTISRADGGYDMAVNGGSEVLLTFQKDGFLPAQRQVTAPWQDYAAVDDVALVAADPHSTLVSFSPSGTAIQIAQGSTQQDSAGTRKESILFQPGTTATITLPDGSTQVVTTAHVRATEFTVGPNGPTAMPAALPPTSAYTYCVDLSLDEGLASGANYVQFNKPVVAYNENFLSAPAGTVVPVGYYDQTQGQWKAEPNGVVIKVLSVTNGLADLDVDGSGTVGSSTAYATLGISDAERAQIATLYARGASFWRMAVTHFSIHDLNMGTYNPPTTSSPKLPPYRSANTPSIPGFGSIETTNQVFDESLPVGGTPFRLHYTSSRVPGNLASFTIKIPVTGSTLPDHLSQVDVGIKVAGQVVGHTFTSPTPNLTYTFTWDGKDAFGRTLQGQQPLTYAIVNHFPTQYASISGSPTGPPAFARFPNVPIQMGSDGRETVFVQQIHTTIGTWNEYMATGLGGWTLDVHHSYDPVGRTLYLGNGTQRSAASLNNIIQTVVGNGSTGGGGDGGPATQAQLYNNDTVAVGPDGSLYTSSGQLSRVRKVDANRKINAFAGGGAYYQSNCPQQTDQFGDGCPATNAYLNGNQSVAIGPDGSVYIADTYNQRIRKVDPNGIISTVAGSGPVVDFCGDVQHTCVEGAFSGDGGPAIQAHFNFPHDVAVGRDGSIYIDDTGNNRIRRVGPDGIITTVAGTGSDGFTPDGQPAMGAAINVNHGGSIALGPDGSLYFLENGNNVIRKVTPDGILHTVAGNGSFTSLPPDGALATSGGFGNGGVERMALGPEGSLYFSVLTHTVYQVTPDGIERKVAGTNDGFSGDTGPATRAQLLGPNGLAVSPDGSLYIADRLNERIRKVNPALPGLGISDFLVPSQDGTELYQFDANGRHLSTLNALTGAVMYTFDYSAGGQFSSITDGDGNKTVIDRDASGNPVDIKGPYGQITSLSLDASGNLATVSDPANETVQLGYSTGGLLTSLRLPRGNSFSFTYDAFGRLVKAADPAHGSTTLTGSDTLTGRTVTLTTPMNRTSTSVVDLLPSGVLRDTAVNPDGTTTARSQGTDDSILTSDPDGTKTVLIQGPDSRFGMQSAIPTNETVTMPSGLKWTRSMSRTATLSTPADPRTLTGLIDTLTLNGNVETTTYTASGGTGTFDTSTAGGRTSTASIDSQGRTTSDSGGGLAALNYTYDTHGRLATIVRGSGSTARTTTLSYGGDGYLASILDPVGRTTRFTHDPMGRILTETLPGNRTVTFTYDSDGNLLSVTPPGRTPHTLDYSTVGLVNAFTPPSLSAGSTATQYSYNADRQLTGVTRPDGQTLSLSYDSGGRVATVTEPTGTLTYSYSATTGTLTSISGPGGVATSYSYDGFLPTGTSWTGPVSGSVTQGYNSSFLANSQSVNGTSVSFGYDADGLLTQAGDLSLTRTTQNGLVTGTSLGTISTAHSYNPFGEGTGIGVSAGSSVLFDQQYTRDAGSRVTQVVETIGGITHTFSYHYNPAGQLDAVQKDGTTVASYGYDSNGNRTSATDSSGSHSATTDAQDRLTQYGNATYSYNTNGELTGKTISGQTTGYSYDAAGNMLGVTKPGGTPITYLLDGRGRRIGKQVNGTLVQGFLYADALRPVAELDGTNSVVSRFVYTNSTGAPAYMIKGGVEYRIVTDQAGSVRLVVNTQDGSIAQRLDYDAFGRVLQDTAPGFQPFGFKGGVYDRDSGLVQFGAREYDPETGRWTTKDPLQFGGGDFNLYGYAINDPVNLSDPSGALLQDTLVAVYSAISAVGPLKDAASTAVTLGDARRHALDVLASDPAHAPDQAITQAQSNNLLPALQAAGGAVLEGAKNSYPSLPGEAFVIDWLDKRDAAALEKKRKAACGSAGAHPCTGVR